MKTDFKQSALDFVRENHCAMHTPVELIQKAMEHGANEVLSIALDKVKEARIHIELDRKRNAQG